MLIRKSIIINRVRSQNNFMCSALEGEGVLPCLSPHWLPSSSRLNRIARQTRNAQVRVRIGSAQHAQHYAQRKLCLGTSDRNARANIWRACAWFQSVRRWVCIFFSSSCFRKNYAPIRIYVCVCGSASAARFMLSHAPKLIGLNRYRVHTRVLYTHVSVAFIYVTHNNPHLRAES